MAIGVDIEDVSRFKDKSSKFLKRIFTPAELEYCMKFSQPENHLAARFSAKEAAIKALSALNIKISSYNVIEVYNNANGYPNIRILKDINKNIVFNLSLSHDKTKAIAFVTAEEL